MVKQARGRIICVVIALTLIATACGKEKEVVEDLRALRTITIEAPATGQLRKFSGVVSAADSARLSFEVGGRVETVNVDIGNTVKKGQVLATLDKEPYQLDVEAAQAEVVKAEAAVVDTKAEYERQERVYRQGAGAKSKLDSAKYNYEEVQSGQNVFDIDSQGEMEVRIAVPETTVGRDLSIH